METDWQPATRRKSFLIDPAVQGSLLRRLAFYCLACSLYCLLTLIIAETLSNPGEPITETTRRCLEEAAFWAPGMALLVPIIAYDLMRVTDRFVGPIFRLRRQLRRLAEGCEVQPLEFREGDYWQDLVLSFNSLQSELARLREVRAKADTRPNQQGLIEAGKSPLIDLDQQEPHSVGADDPITSSC